jgi:DNA-binding XRE family transcriptional regulator
MSQRLIVLLIEARHALGGMNQGAFGELLGSSRRTGQRWESGTATPSATKLRELARLLHPHDPTLAANVAAEAGTTLEALGILPAPPEVIDALVGAAAEAIGVTPHTIRPALLAAFAHARHLGLRVEDVERALSETRTKTDTPAEDDA